MLRCLVQPSLHIDLAVHIPAECLVPRDSLNHRYLDKRALYAGQIAKEALDKAGGVGRLVERVEVRATVPFMLPMANVAHFCMIPCKRGAKINGTLRLTGIQCFIWMYSRVFQHTSPFMFSAMPRLTCRVWACELRFPTIFALLTS